MKVRTVAGKRNPRTVQALNFLISKENINNNKKKVHALPFTAAPLSEV
jgi:hypothetical protein